MGPLAHNLLLQPHLVFVAVSAVTGGAALARARLCVVLTRAACPVLLVTCVCMAITLTSEEREEVIEPPRPTGAQAGCCKRELQPMRPEEETEAHRGQAVYPKATVLVSGRVRIRTQDGRTPGLTDHSEGRGWNGEAVLRPLPQGPLSLFAQESPPGLLGNLRFSTGLRERVSHLSLVLCPQPLPQGISAFPD